jgi:Flp pilus assembly protein TadD
MNPTAQMQWLKYGVCLLLVALTCAAYASVAHNAFIAFDDRDYVIANHNIQQGFSWGSIKWAFSTFHSNNWHPLTWLSHMLDCKFYALDPAGPHLTNVAFHVANTVLLFLLLQNVTSKIWRSAFVAMLFGLHPMHVESVAWVAERKDVLSTFFFLLTLLAYARYAELALKKKPVRWGAYGLALLLFALGLMAKPMLVTLPGILCLLDLWPLKRFMLPLKSEQKPVLYRLVVEKIPFILLSMLSCWVTFFVQKSTGAVIPAEQLPLGQRLEHLPFSYGWYMLKIFWPAHLSIFYPAKVNEPGLELLLASLLVLGATVLAFWRIRKEPYFFVGWFWFLGTLVPVIGIVQVGNQAYADRYTYIPYIGLFISLAWGVAELFAKWPAPRRMAVLWTAGLLLMAACFWRTVVEVHYWRDGQALFKRAVALDPGNSMAWALLGLEYEAHGNNNQATDCMKQATTLDDHFNWAWHDLGHMLVIKGDYASAIHAFQMSLAYTLYAPFKKDIYNNLGDAYLMTGDYNGAISNYQNSLQFSANQPDIQIKLGQSFAHNNQPDQAIAAFQKAVVFQPDNTEAHLNLAILLESTGRDSEAIEQYQKIIELEPDAVIVLNNLAWLLATDSDARLRNGSEAISLAEHACELTHFQEPLFIGTLAAAYAEAGRFNEAVDSAGKARDVALAHGEQRIADQNRHLLELYKTGHPFHMDAQTRP